MKSQPETIVAMVPHEGDEIIPPILIRTKPPIYGTVYELRDIIKE